MRINRKEFIQNLKEERFLRKIIRRGIHLIESKNQKQESKLRILIRNILSEASTSKIKVHDTTAGNELERLFSTTNFKEVLSTDYHALRTSPEQRTSFAAHVLHAITSLLDRDQINRREDDEYEKEQTSLKATPETGIDLNVVDPDIEEERKVQKEQEKKFLLISGMDEAGALAAERTWKQLEPAILNALTVAGSNPQDRAQFEEYLIINVTGYFKEWEKAIQAKETKKVEAPIL